MMEIWKNEKIYWAGVFLYFTASAFLLLTTPLNPAEAKLFFSGIETPTLWMARLVHRWIPGPVGVRLFPYLLGIINAYLYWRIVRSYFARRDDARFAFVIYLLLPGVIASGVLLNEATYALTAVLFFLLAYRRDNLLLLQILALLMLLPSPTATFSFYGMLALYGYRKEKRRIMWLGFLFLLLCVGVGNYDFRGRPQGHFLELMGVYAALFSPLFFVYYFYSLYRVSLEGPRDIYWTVASGALVISILLSVRQQVLIVDFSPYLLAGAMIPVAVYLRSLRVRIRRFQRAYRLAGGVVIFSMLLSALLLFLHRPLYEVLGKPRHFFIAPLYQNQAEIDRLLREGAACHPPVGKREEPVYRFYDLLPCTR
ncbi:hypothetical protein [Nitratifractor sp.]